ncbi:MAG: hypothetical protein R2794_05845 [Chitinophagales bacterium]
MKKWLYFLAMACTFALATSCGGKDKGDDSDDMDDMTMVVTTPGAFA